jgi:hypothetical protein
MFVPGEYFKHRVKLSAPFTDNAAAGIGEKVIRQLKSVETRCEAVVPVSCMAPRDFCLFHWVDGFDVFQDNVHDPGVDFLRAGGVVGGDNDGVVADAPGFSTGFAQEADGGQVQPSGGLDGADDVGGVSAAAEGDEEIAGLTQTLDLAGENGVVSPVVGNAGQGGDISGQADCGEGTTTAAVAADEFLGHVEGISGAATVAAGENFVASLKTLFKQGEKRLDLW